MITVIIGTTIIVMPIQNACNLILSVYLCIFNVNEILKIIINFYEVLNL